MSKSLEIAVAAGPHPRELTPVSFVAELPNPLREAPLRLVDTESGRALPCQVEADGSGLSAILDTLDAGQIRRFRLEKGEPAEARVELTDIPGERVEIRINGSLFTSYHYSRSRVRQFLYPVIGPYGARMTRGYPIEELPGERTDHPHHKSIWFAHGDVSGHDIWSESGEHGSMTHERFIALESGPVYGRIAEESFWRSHSGRPVLFDRRELRFYALPDDRRIVDVSIELSPVESPVVFGDTKEAGILSVRVASSMDGDRGGRIETGAGAIGEKEAWGKKAPWCDYSGPVATPWGFLRAGIALFDHPSNPRYPTNWHVRDYGLMTANCFGLHDFAGTQDRLGELPLGVGESLAFRYRIYLHPGDASAGKVWERYQDYIYPPTVRL